MSAIDLVYMWVDGNDPKWQEKKRIFTGKLDDNSEQNNKGRYVSNDELKYSLRSVAKHAPWVRKIFIITDNQKPEWLDVSHPKIQIVDHKEIMPADILPCFNSMLIEHFLHEIPDLSEFFLLANDDNFFNDDLLPDYFFAKDGYPIVRLKRKFFGRWRDRWKKMTGKKIGHYRNQVIESSILVDRKFGKYYSGIPHHNVDAYRKSDYKKAVVEVFVEQARISQTNRVRANGDLLRSAFGYYALAIGHGHLKYVGKGESLRLLPYKHDLEKYIKRYSPKLFCLNDDELSKDEHREMMKSFLEKLFPKKSAFEK